MARSRLLPWILLAVTLLPGCDKRKNKPDPTKGAVAGIVICADTGKPARFATVTLTPVPAKHAEPHDDPPLAAIATIDTDLDGRFRMEAIPAGNYYAFSTLDGYLDPQRGVDFGSVESKKTTSEQEWDAIQQWKDQLVEVKVAVHRVSQVTIEVHRAAEIEGTVKYDDGSPAIGMHFQLFRKNAKKDWNTVGLSLFANWTIDSTSDSHGYYVVNDLAAGEYIVCAMMPIESEDVAPRVCLGNVFRRKNATTVKVNDGETEQGIDIEIPLSGLHNISGRVEAVADGHAPSRATVKLLYADDREPARRTAIDEDGSFVFEYVPEDSYVLRVEDAADVDDGDSKNGKLQAEHRYQVKEMPVRVQSDLRDLDLPLVDEAAAKSQ